MSNSRDFFTLDDFDFSDKSILVRVDINSPIDPISGRLLDDTRIRHHSQTIKDLADGRAIIIAHQSSPGKNDFTNLSRHAERISLILKKRVRFIDSLFDAKALAAVQQMRNGDVLLLENTRFYAEDVALKDATLEVQARSHIVRRLSSVADYFVSDAFAAAHRSQPTLVGFGECIPAIAGRVMERELKMLGQFMEKKGHTLAILGGAKVEDTISIMKNMLNNNVVDKVLTGGLVANVFLLAKGVALGQGSVNILKKEIRNHGNLIIEASSLLRNFPDRIIVPTDVTLNRGGRRTGMTISNLPSEHSIVDLGLDTVVQYLDIIKSADNIIVNGPMGVFELEEFSLGTIEVFRAVAESNAFSVVGGGHTVSVIKSMGLAGKIDHISTGGGALIHMLSGKPLPVVEALKRSKIKYEKGELEEK